MLKAMVGEDITVQQELADDVYDIWIDVSTFIQILTNLASNSRDAIKDIGNIKIVTKNRYLDEEFCTMHHGCKPGDYAMIQFSDDGIGMDKETLDKIFEPFFTTKEVGKGTGLGLSTVYGIVKQFNGYINVYSEPGKGTVVTIYFPKYVEEIPSISTYSETENFESPLQKNTILVVEDDRNVLEMLKKMLALLGQEVIAFNDPLDAIQAIDRYKDTITIVITDIIMPHMNGTELYKKLLLVKPSLKAIFISGYSDDTYKDVLQSMQGTYFMQKPFTVEDLKKALNAICT